LALETPFVYRRAPLERSENGLAIVAGVDSTISSNALARCRDGINASDPIPEAAVLRPLAVNSNRIVISVTSDSGRESTRERKERERERERVCVCV